MVRQDRKVGERLAGGFGRFGRGDPFLQHRCAVEHRLVEGIVEPIDLFHLREDVRFRLVTDRRDPGLDRRAPPTRRDEADRHIQLAMQVTPEEIEHRRERAHRLWRALDPLAVDMMGRRAGGSVRDLEQANLGVVGRGDHFRSVACPLGYRPLHVRLPRPEPHLADQNVLEGDGVPTGNRYFDRLSGGNRFQSDAPVPLFIGLGRGSVVADRHGNFFFRLGPTPNHRRSLPLQDHVVADDLRQAHVGSAAVAR